MITLALFGAGRIGRVHALNLMSLGGVRIAFIADPVPSEGRERLLHETGAASATPEEIFSNDNLDGYLIASPTDTHAELLRRAAATGKPVFCEKPISLDFRTVLDVEKIMNEARNRVMLGFQRRYDPDFLHVKREISSGENGVLQHIIMHTRDPEPPPVSYIRSSGGLFRDQAIHDFDMTRYLLGEEIESVMATGECLIDPAIGRAGDIDTAMITLRSQSGRLVQMINTRHAAFGYDQRLEAVCAKQIFYVCNHPAHAVVSGAPDGFLSPPPVASFIERFAKAYRAEMVAFLEFIKNNVAPLAVLSDGVAAQRLAEAAALSLIRRAPVQVSEIN